MSEERIKVDEDLAEQNSGEQPLDLEQLSEIAGGAGGHAEPTANPRTFK